MNLEKEIENSKFWKERYEQILQQHPVQRPNDQRPTSTQSKKVRPESGMPQSRRISQDEKNTQKNEQKKTMQDLENKKTDIDDDADIKKILKKIRFKLMAKRISTKYIEFFLFDEDQNSGISNKLSLQKALVNQPFHLNEKDAIKFAEYLVGDESYQNDDIVTFIQKKIKKYQIIDDNQQTKLDQEILLIFKENQIDQKNEESSFKITDLKHLKMSSLQKDYLLMCLSMISDDVTKIQYKHFYQYLINLDQNIQQIQQSQNEQFSRLDQNSFEIIQEYD